MTSVLFITSFVDGDGTRCEGPVLPVGDSIWDWGAAHEVLAWLIASGNLPRSARIDAVEDCEIEVCLNVDEINRQLAGGEASLPPDDYPLTFSLN